MGQTNRASARSNHRQNRLRPVHEELATSFRTYDQAMLASGQSRSNQEWVVYPDGQRVLLETVKTPWLDANGKVLGLVGICHDITARQQTHSD